MLSRLNSPIRLTIFLFAIGFSGLHTAGHSAADERTADESSAPIMPLLKGYEWQFEADKFKALPPDSYQALLQIARNRDHPGFIRERAMAALRIYPNDEVWAFFNEAVRNTADKVKRRRAVQAMCQAFAENHAGRVENAIVELLEDEDPHLRVKVARCLKTLHSESARERFNGYRSRISKTWEAKAVDSPRTQ